MQMAEAVAEAMAGGEHLLVQAGTGTGKSLGYLVPACCTTTGSWWPRRRSRCSTSWSSATSRRCSRRSATCSVTTRRTPCSRAAPTTPACTGSARACPTTRAPSSTCPRGRWAPRSLELREWAEEEAEGRRHRRARPRAPAHRPGVAAGQRSATASASARPSARTARSASPSGPRQGQRVHLIVTNHSLLAIDAIEGVPMIPEYDVVVIDEAHELVSRVTQAATDELSVAEIDRASRRRSQRHVEGAEADDLADAGDALRDAIDGGLARADRPACPSSSATRWSWSATRPAPASRRSPRTPTAGEADAGLHAGQGWVQELFKTAERMAAAPRRTCLWMAEGGDRLPRPALRRAARGLGADARQAARRQDRRLHLRDPQARRRLQRGRHLRRAQAGRPCRSTATWSRQDPPTWTAPTAALAGLDVGSPFDYGQQAILYVAQHLPQPGRDGLGEAHARRDRRAGRRRRAAAPSGCSRRAGPPRPPPRRSASRCRT